MTSGGEQSIFNPAGPGASAIAALGWIVFGLLTLVTLIMIGLLLWVALRRRGTLAEHAPVEEPPEVVRAGQRWILFGGLILPALILAFIFVLGIGALDRFPLHDEEAHLGPDIRIRGHQWWWEVIYQGLSPSSQLRTANEIHIPVGQPVEFALESADVIHSFWVPRLHGKVDLVPGITNHIRLQADAPGTYEGQCSQFCGANHALMRFLVVAQSRPDFARWLSDQAAPAKPATEPVAAAGEALFVGHACALCHTVRGTLAVGVIGPDLTHVGSRQRLASDSLPNSHAYLSAWIVRAQSFKPGALMPDVNDFDGLQLEAVSSYVRGLK